MKALEVRIYILGWKLKIKQTIFEFSWRSKYYFQKIKQYSDYLINFFMLKFKKRNKREKKLKWKFTIWIKFN